MTEYLVWTLAGAMGAFGNYAGPERRRTAVLPARSAIIGLVGAALGIRRDNTTGLTALRTLAVAAQSMSPGASLSDYHTAASDPRDPNADRVVTIRDYRCDVAVRIALWATSPALALEQVRAGLERPQLTLYIGRKSCPLMHPTGARIVEAPTPGAALAQVPRPWWLPALRPGTIATDAYPGGAALSIEEQHCEPVDRTHWHFQPREIWHMEDPGPCPSS